MTSGTQEMLAVFDVNGDTTDASASESEMPAWAVRSAPQSLAPSPHIPTYRLTHTHTHTYRQTHIHIYIYTHTNIHTHTYRRTD